MKVVINVCFGGFSLSPAATRRFAELKGRPCYFYRGGLGEPYTRIEEAAAKGTFMWHAFDVPDADTWELSPRDYHSPGYKAAAKVWNDRYSAHSLYYSEIERDDPLLIQVVEELGVEAASGSLAELKIVEIPDGIEWRIDEYDGTESIAETHRSWS